MHSPSTRENLTQAHERAGLARWRALTRKANAAFAAGRHAEALRVYAQALRAAERLTAGPALALAPEDCLAALVVAHHNLSDGHRRNGDPAAALEHLCLPHRALTTLAADPGAPQRVRLAAVAHLRETRFALLDWQARHGACARTDALLRDSLAALSSPAGDGRCH